MSTHVNLFKPPRRRGSAGPGLYIKIQRPHEDQKRPQNITNRPTETRKDQKRSPNHHKRPQRTTKDQMGPVWSFLVSSGRFWSPLVFSGHLILVFSGLIWSSLVLSGLFAYFPHSKKKVDHTRPHETRPHETRRDERRQRRDTQRDQTRDERRQR